MSLATRTGASWVAFSYLMVTAVPLAAASVSPDGEWLIYAFIGDPESIFLAGFGGASPRPLVDREIREFRPEWFPDSRQILFSSAVEGGRITPSVLLALGSRRRSRLSAAGRSGSSAYGCFRSVA